MKRILALLAGLGFLGALTYAQDNPIQIFTSSINPETGAVSFVWVDVNSGRQTPVASFATGSDCPPQKLGDTFFYEPQNLAGENFIYQVDLTSGNITPFMPAQEQNLHCPVITPDGTQMAWLQYGEAATSLIFTTATGANQVVVATHPTIYDALWSPDSEILIFTAIDEDETFRPLYAYQTQETGFWARDAGLVVDYMWTPDSQTLLVAYYTQDEAVIGTLSRECVVNGGCNPTPLSAFPPEAGLILEDAFSPDGTQFLVIEETNDGMGAFQSEIYVANLVDGSTRRLVDMDGLLKISAAWHGETIYFIGSVFDVNTFTLADSAIYSIAPDGSNLSVAYQADDYLPAQIFWVAQP